jgi:putative acetyltransferase
MGVPGRPCAVYPPDVPTTIRPESPADVDVVRDVVAAAFGEHAEHVLTMLDGLRADPAWVDGLSLVAECDDVVVGHVLLTRVRVETERGPLAALTLTPLSVLPEAQGRGIGTSLVTRALNTATAGGWPLVVLEGDPRYYGRRGFVAAEPHGLPSPSALIPPGAWQVALLPDHEPWMTGPVTLSAPLLADNDDPSV